MANSGLMNRKISVYKKTLIREMVYGTEVEAWEPISYDYSQSPPIAERWFAEVRDILPSRSEYVNLGIPMNKRPSRLRMRYRYDIDSTMKIIVHGETDVEYQIISGPAEIDGRKGMLEMMIERYK
jgi:head-tail adaptor